MDCGHRRSLARHLVVLKLIEHEHSNHDDRDTGSADHDNCHDRFDDLDTVIRKFRQSPAARSAAGLSFDLV